MAGKNSLFGPLDPATDAGYEDPPPRKGFFTDTSVCIGCKACEVACKEWNLIPGGEDMDLLGSSYDNTGALTANSWRHVTFIEQKRPAVSLGMPGGGPPAATESQTASMPAGPDAAPGAGGCGCGGGASGGGCGSGASGGGDTGAGCGCGSSGGGCGGASGGATPSSGPVAGIDGGDADGMDVLAMAGEEDARMDFRWLMSSDVCKHCTHAACLDVCPTGSLFRTEFGTVVVQPDICNGCGYCVPACPYGVIDRRKAPDGALNVGIAQKCTLCYDRLGDGLEPACAQACPTDSIQFGDVDELRERAERRRASLQGQGVTEARLYGHDPNDGVGGTGAFFLLLDEPEVYGLPPDPIVPTRDMPRMFARAAVAATALLAGAALAFVEKR